MRNKEIEIRHKVTGVLLLRAEVRGEHAVHVFDADLTGAAFRGQTLHGSHFTLTRLNDADFSGTECIGLDLYSSLMGNTDFSEAHLVGMQAEGGNFISANLRGANMEGANLRHASLSNADLRNTNLRHANFSNASVQYADFRGADLTEAIFHRTFLEGANFAGATMASTVFADCPTLDLADRLSEIIHVSTSERYPNTSSIDRQTLAACIASLPYEFLLGMGYTNDEISKMKADQSAAP